MKKIIQTPQQRANTLEAINVMWPSVPPENVDGELRRWRRNGTSFLPPSCGTIACFGGWVEWWPSFRKQAGLAPDYGSIRWEAAESLFYPLETVQDIFSTRTKHIADEGFTGTDHELVTHRLQWLLDNSEVRG